MRRLLVALSLVVSVAAAVVPVSASTSSAPVRQGPAGSDFYIAPPGLVAGRHGTVIWARPLSGAAVLEGARSWLVLYRSVDLQGRTVAVSGTVDVPVGTAPAGGWPVISWGHGTTGVADVCAPSLDSATGPAHDYLGLVDTFLDGFTRAGYAVLRTDYQGLGTPDPHSYLIGAAEARAVADLALAARELSPDLSRTWFVMGHSQGGGAAAWTAQDGQAWAPSLHLAGALALAPGSHYKEALQAVRQAPGTTAALDPLLIRGVESQVPLDEATILTDRARALMPQADQQCVAYLRRSDSWGGMPSNGVFKQGADLSAFDDELGKVDPASVTPRVPVFVAQGSMDTTVPEPLTDALAVSLVAHGGDVTYKVYPQADHRGVLTACQHDALAWIASLTE